MIEIYPLKEKNVDIYVDAIIDAGKTGVSLEVFLLQHGIRMSEWEKFSRRHKKIRLAMNDANEFCKAVALKKVNKLMKDKDINGQIAKMYLENTAGWGKAADLTDKAPPTIKFKFGKTIVMTPEEKEQFEMERLQLLRAEADKE